MQKQPLTFDQFPEYIYELGLKVDQLTALLSSASAATSTDEVGGIELAACVTKKLINHLRSQDRSPH